VPHGAFPVRWVRPVAAPFPLQVVINIDQGNYLKANCGIDLNGNGNFTLSVQAQQLGRWHDTDGIPQVATAITNAVINQSTYVCT